MLLSAKTREKILKIPGFRYLTNIYVNISNSIFYYSNEKKGNYKEKIKAIKRNSDTCFIVGSGPSLTMEQLDAITKYDSFGANRIYKIFEKTNWRPNYYVIQDPYDPTPKENYEKLNINYLFVSDYYWKENGMKNENAICYHTIRTLKQRRNLPFSKNVANHVQVAGTVTYTMIQIAAYLGYKKIYLIGMDHNYANETNSKGKITKRNDIKSHIFEDEKPNEVVANILYMEYAYESAKKFCKENGIEIYNATLGGKLEVFERKDFWKIIKEDKKNENISSNTC